MFNNQDIKFKYSWRPYQANVLDEVKKHIRDNKIHIVAAPGSGKTVLGLELARSFGNAVLILSPTLTIKHQWIDRFVNLFMKERTDIPEWISDDIYDLKYFNSVTYQGLHYAYKRKKMRKTKNEDTDDDELFNEELNQEVEIDTYDIIDQIKEKKIKTIVLDEAHHLKSEWWKSLTEVIEQLEDITLVSLTATPPYDVEYSQWKKYMELCGPIDAEISVPELVAVDNLCPHQDYIYFNYPTKDEQQYIAEYKSNIEGLINSLQANQEFVDAVYNHPYIQYTTKYEEEILENPKYYSSMIIFLNSAKINIDRSKVKILGHNEKIPKLNLEWLEILLQNCIFDDRENYTKYEQTMEFIETRINDIGCIDKKKIMLVENKNLQKYFVNSIGKLNSINEIVKIETNSLKQDLRMVILTDFIRKEYLEDPNMELNKLGVFPIFINLLKENPNLDVAILTGSLFAVPSSKKDLLVAECINLGIEEKKLNFTTLPINENYLIVKTVEMYRNPLMKSIAKIFSNGDINIIIGTKSLLGEGWDEPSINSLVLASFVGSYMLSNQMRGRAIRTNDNPRKTANVWHLVCITDFKDDVIKNVDYEMLKRRFNCFVGIGYNNDVIESGISRIDIIPNNLNSISIDNYKNELAQTSIKRDEMYDKWKRLSTQYDKKQIKVVQTIEVEEEELTNKFRILDFKKIFKSVYHIILILIIKTIIEFLIFGGEKGFISSILTTLIVLIIFKETIKIAIKVMFVRVPKRVIKQIAKITLYCLCRYRFIQTDFDEIKIVSEGLNSNSNAKYLQCYIVGATPYENNVFVKSMKEIFSKVENQRYIIVKDKLKIKKISSYYNIPSLLSQNKEMATEFYELWNRKIEATKLIYTHTQEGRQILLNARVNSFDYDDKILEKQKVISAWK